MFWEPSFFHIETNSSPPFGSAIYLHYGVFIQTNLQYTEMCVS